MTYKKIKRHISHNLWSRMVSDSLITDITDFVYTEKSKSFWFGVFFAWVIMPILFIVVCIVISFLSRLI